jgi:transposase
MSRVEMEERRLAAAMRFRALDDGEYPAQAQVAREMGVSRTTASRWHRTLTRQGIEGLLLRRAPGRPCRLTPAQQEIVRRAVRRELPPTERRVWTAQAVADMIAERTGVRYHRDHAYRLLPALGLVRRGGSWR